MQNHELIESPLNYTGGKYRLLPQILPLFPSRCHEFVDLFCGGGNVGVNANADKVWFNDKNDSLLNIFQVFKKRGAESVLSTIRYYIKKYGLSDVSSRGYDYYKCSSSDGLAAYNKSHFLRLRADTNAKKSHDDYYFIMLYVLIIYSFNNQIRFNSKGMFNLPVGKRDFNQRMIDKFNVFVQQLYDMDCRFTSLDFRAVNKKWLKNDFVYADPPYLITMAGYNESNGWTRQDEADLLQYLDILDDKGVSFALSNVFASKGKKNDILIQWCESKHYNVHHLVFTYANANYHRKNKEKKTDEVLITNY